MGQELREHGVDPTAAAVGARIRMARKGSGLTAERLAEAADISTQFLAKVEKGQQSMTIGKFSRLVQALGVTADYLLFGHDELAGRAALAAEYMGTMNVIERDMMAQVVIHLRGTLAAMRPEEGGIEGADPSVGGRR